MKPEIAQQILQKTKRDYRDLAEVFSASRFRPWLEVKSLIKKYVKDGMKILDLGCGNGRLLELLKEGVVEYVGVDSCERLIQIAKQKPEIRNPTTAHFQWVGSPSPYLNLRAVAKSETNSKSQISNSKFKIPQSRTSPLRGRQNSKFRFVVADALDLPFEDKSFDLVFAIALLHHIPSKELRLKVLRNCFRVLKPDGFLILTVWNLWQPKLLLKYKIWSMIFGWRPKGLDWKDIWIPWKLPQGQVQRYYHAFTAGEMKRLLKKAGFKIEELSYVKKGQPAKWFNGWNLAMIARP